MGGVPGDGAAAAGGPDGGPITKGKGPVALKQVPCCNTAQSWVQLACPLSVYCTQRGTATLAAQYSHRCSTRTLSCQCLALQERSETKLRPLGGRAGASLVPAER
eukprot:356625-Chlamydomonas_euryale.AAC.2